MTIIERFEKNVALLEQDGEIIKVDRGLIPLGAKEGDLLVLTNGFYSVDIKGTEDRRNEILRKMKGLGL
ncbi:MAG: DUF3006 domain-containing protein [Eubacterium sp.]|jgi:hypothetical protein|nr:DUF3006 domain-containing protein [Eubacterium sp.]